MEDNRLPANQNPTNRTRRQRMNNENASAGGLAGLFIIFLVCAFFTAALGPVVDNINHANNRMANTPGLPMSQERMTTMELL
jgi:hypothetical protein